jgi:acetyl-CoA synthetase
MKRILERLNRGFAVHGPTVEVIRKAWSVGSRDPSRLAIERPDQRIAFSPQRPASLWALLPHLPWQFYLLGAVVPVVQRAVPLCSADAGLPMLDTNLQHCAARIDDFWQEAGPKLVAEDFCWREVVNAPLETVLCHHRSDIGPRSRNRYLVSPWIPRVCQARVLGGHQSTSRPVKGSTVVWQSISKNVGDFAVRPNMADYEEVRLTFSWDDARELLDGLPEGRGLNIAHEAVDRHANSERRNHVAIRWLGKKNQTRDITYAELSQLTNQFANVLELLGVHRGDGVFTMLGRIPELYVAALGALKARAFFCPLFSVFGPEPVRQRLTRGDARVLVTTASLYETKVKDYVDDLPSLSHVLIAGLDPAAAAPPGTRNLTQLMADADKTYSIGPTDPEDVALLHFTSGTTGLPKGALHVHEAIVAHYMTGLFALDLQPDDIYWCTADPGWVTGTSYGIIAPLAHGLTSIVDEAEFDAQHWYRTLERERVTVWYTAPTAIRMLMRLGCELPKAHDLSSLRFVASVGEPLHPEGVLWGKDALGLPVHDNWWQTETGGVMIANFAAMDIRPGSMGRPLPGIEAAIVDVDEGANSVRVIAEPDTQGMLALATGWPSMFRGYLHDEERYQKCFADGWYLTGDLARLDKDGYFWFVGRADDVIKSAGHLIGPFEVESALMEHPVVAEAAVIGKPEPTVGEVVKAFVSLTEGTQRTEEIKLEIMGFARRRLGTAVAPKEIEFIASIPKTRSGKVMRRLLKARELGLPEGDLSTMEQT